MTEAEAYVRLALQAIKFARSAKDLREWWSGEAARRKEYAISGPQNTTLVKACRERTAELDRSKKQTNRDKGVRPGLFESE